MVQNNKHRTSPDIPQIGGYIRVSTAMQVERGESLTVQEQRLRAEAKHRGYKLVLYCEPGISAKDDNRPAYQKMRADVEAGRVNGVMATRLDRLWRDIRLAVNEAYFITQICNRELITLDQRFDTTTAAGRAMLNTLLTFGQFEREIIAERVGEAMRARAREGKFNGGPIPYGYCRAGKGKLVIEESEAETIRQMFDLFLEKRTIRGVCLALNAAGKLTREEYAWPNQTIRRILRSPIYYGELVYNTRDTSTGKARTRSEDERIRVANAVPAIVSLQTFKAVQAILEARPALAPRAQASDYLLAGLLECELCGGNMTGQATWGRGRKVRHRYYRCANYMQKGRTTCRGNSVRADILEEVIIESLFDLRVNPDKLRADLKAQMAREQAEVAPLKREVSRLEAELSKITSREDRVMLAFEQGAYSLTLMKRRQAEVVVHRANLETALAEAKARLVDSNQQTFSDEFWMDVFETAFDFYYELPFDDRRRLMHALIDQVIVGRDGGHFSFRGLGEWGGLFDGEVERRSFVRKQKKHWVQMPEWLGGRTILVQKQTLARADI